MYKVVIVKEDPNFSKVGFGFERKVFELYLSTAESVCDLIQKLDSWHLGFHLEFFELSDGVIDRMFDKIKRDLDLK